MNYHFQSQKERSRYLAGYRRVHPEQRTEVNRVTIRSGVVRFLSKENAVLEELGEQQAKEKYF